MQLFQFRNDSRPTKLMALDEVFYLLSPHIILSCAPLGGQIMPFPGFPDSSKTAGDSEVNI